MLITKSAAPSLVVVSFMKAFFLFVGCLLLIPWGHAHEDLDLGIARVYLDKHCRVNLTMVNSGHQLPYSFYQTVTPAYVQIKKGAIVERLRSLRALDRRQALKNLGGKLTLRSKMQYANMPEPIQLVIIYDEEFGDYGAGNNTWLESMDCEIGVGQIEGAPIVYTEPDVAITDARIDPKTCTLTIEVSNLTSIPLDDNAWNSDTGVSLMQLNLDTQQRAPDIPLLQLDPQKAFGHQTQHLRWQTKVPFKGAQRIRLALWRVLGDVDFSNNTVELAVPEGCG